MKFRENNNITHKYLDIAAFKACQHFTTYHFDMPGSKLLIADGHPTLDRQSYSNPYGIGLMTIPHNRNKSRTCRRGSRSCDSGRNSPCCAAPCAGETCTLWARNMANAGKMDPGMNLYSSLKLKRMIFQLPFSIFTKVYEKQQVATDTACSTSNLLTYCQFADSNMDNSHLKIVCEGGKMARIFLCPGVGV